LRRDDDEVTVRNGRAKDERVKPERAAIEEADRDAVAEIRDKLREIAANLERAQINDYVQLMNRPWKIIRTNMLAGIARGVGIAIGVTVFTSTIVYLLQQLGALDLPIIGKYIAEIVRVVQYQLNGRMLDYP